MSKQNFLNLRSNGPVLLSAGALQLLVRDCLVGLYRCILHQKIRWYTVKSNGLQYVSVGRRPRTAAGGCVH